MALRESLSIDLVGEEDGVRVDILYGKPLGILVCAFRSEEGYVVGIFVPLCQVKTPADGYTFRVPVAFKKPGAVQKNLRLNVRHA